MSIYYTGRYDGNVRAWRSLGQGAPAAPAPEAAPETPAAAPTPATIIGGVPLIPMLVLAGVTIAIVTTGK